MPLSVNATADQAGWYVLELRGNRARYESGEDTDPFAVLIEPMSGYEKEQFERKLGKVSRGEEINVVARAQHARDEIISKRVKEVRGFSVTLPDGSVLAPKNGSDLLDAAKQAGPTVADLVFSEIMDAIQDQSTLEGGLLDRLTSRSDSSSPTTARPEGGDAIAAEGPKGLARA